MQLHLNANCPPNLQDTLVNMVGDFSSGAIYQVQNVDTLVKKEMQVHWHHYQLGAKNKRAVSCVISILLYRRNRRQKTLHTLSWGTMNK